MSHNEFGHPDDQPIEHHDPKEGFDRSEPAVKSIVGFAIGSVVLLILVIVALQGYFEDLYQQAVHDRILVVPSEQLEDLHARDAWNLSHYMYGDHNPQSGRVRIPIDKAMDLFAQEAASGKVFYPAKSAPVKVEEPDPAAPKFR